MFEDKNNLQNHFIEAFGGMLTIGNVQQLIDFLKLETNDDNHIITNVVDINGEKDGLFTKVEAIKLIQDKLPEENGNKLTIEIPIFNGNHFYNYRVEIEAYKKSNDKKLSYKITGFEKIDTLNLDKKEENIDERVKNLIAEACGLQQNEKIEVTKDNNSIEKYSDKVKQKQNDNTSCGWYAVAVLNDIIHNKNNDNNNLGIIGEDEYQEKIKSDEDGDKNLRKKILEKLTLQQVTELYNGYGIEKDGQYKGREDIMLLCKILNKENHPTFFDLNIDKTDVTVINVGTDFYTIKDNTICTIEKGENGYELKEHKKDCNKNVIKYIKYCYNNLEDAKNKELGKIEEIEENKGFKQVGEVKEISIDEFKLAEALILQIMKEEKEMKKENKDDDEEEEEEKENDDDEEEEEEKENDDDEEEEEEKNKEEKNTIKEKIKAIPLNLKIAFLKKLAEEVKEEKEKPGIWKKLEEKYNKDGESEKHVKTFITEMFESLDRNSIKQIFNVQESDNFYAELKKQNDNYLFANCFCKTKNSIEYLKYKLVNNFKDFTKKDKKDKKNENDDNNDHLKNHQISIYDLKDLLKDKEFIKEFKEINKEKNFFDIWNAFEAFRDKKENNNNNEIEHIQLNCGEFFVGSTSKESEIKYNSKETLLDNENIVITNAGGVENKISGGGINGGCASVYGEYSNNVFGLEKGKDYKENERVKLIEKFGNNCGIIKIKQEKEYTMVYLVGPSFNKIDDNGTKSKSIDELDKALNNYIKALKHEELKGKTVVFSGISNAIFAGNYKDYTKDQGGNKFNIMDFYNALYLESKLKKESIRLECNLFFINNASNAMEYIESLQKNPSKEIDLYDLFKNGSTSLDKNDPIFKKIEKLLTDNLGLKIKKQKEILIPVSTISNEDIKKAEKEIETQMKGKIESSGILKKFFKVGDSPAKDIKFNKLDIFNCITYEKNKNSVSEDTKKACEEIKNICKNTTNGTETDTYIIADAVEKSETVEKVYENVLKDDRYKKNHNSMQCTYKKGKSEGKDKYKLKLEIVEGQCKGAKIEFDVPNGLNEMKVFVLIGLYGMNNVINVVNEGNCRIEYNGETYESIDKLKDKNDLKGKLEFQEENKELKQQLMNLTNATEEIGKSIEKKQDSPGQTKQ